MGGDIIVNYCPSEFMLADVLTKPLGEHLFKLMRESLLGMKFLDIK
jgi:hypothetical protein